MASTPDKGGGGWGCLVVLSFLTGSVVWQLILLSRIIHKALTKT